MATSFVNNFTTGRPYVEPTESIAGLQQSSGISLPGGRFPNGDPSDPDEPTGEPGSKENPPGEPVEEPPTGILGELEKGAKEIEQNGAKAIEGSDVPAIEGIARTPISQGVKAIEGAGKNLSWDQFKSLGGDVEHIGTDLGNWGSDANSFLESTSNGGGLVNAAKGTGQFSSGGAGETPPETGGGFKTPDSIGNIGDDLASLAGDLDF